MIQRALVFAAVAWATLSVSGYAEKAPFEPEELVRAATHVVTGEVAAVYDRVTKKGPIRRHDYVAEVRVTTVEKGADVKPGDLIYVRYWSEEWLGPGNPPPGAYGHWHEPKEGESLRIFAAKNASDGYAETKDGGLNVLGPNGFEELKKTVGK